MKLAKRIMVLMLVLSMLVGMLPAAVSATEATGENTGATVDNGEVTIEGTNGFGNLLSEEITEQQEAAAEDASSGYTVTDLEIEGNIATVTYDSLEEATLVVALYTEDVLKMLLSGSTTVIPEETTATVTLEGDMPEYFLASACLLDSYDMSPLCPAYDTPLYTKEMQELLNSTVDDYDADRVLNLDEDKTTNFAVYAEDTIVIEQSQGVNTVSSADDDTLTYVIENADSTITGLKAGDVFVYPYADEEILIVKVASIKVSGTTATITGAELEMEEVFSHVKVEGDSGTEDVVVDDSTAAEGVTYVGMIDESQRARSAKGGASATVFHEFKLELDEKASTDHIDVSYNIKGSLKFQLTVSVNYYVSWNRQYLEFKAVPTVRAGIAITGSIKGKFPVGYFAVSPCPGVYVGFEPQLELGYTGTIDFNVTLTATIGVMYENGTGFKNLTTAPKLDWDLKVEAELTLALDFHPNVSIRTSPKGKIIAKVGLEAVVGVTLTARATGQLYEVYGPDASNIHTCDECLDMDVVFNAKLGGTVTFLDVDWLKLKVTIGSWTIPLGKLYYSLDKNQFGLGTCPNKVYRVLVTVADSNGKCLSGYEVKAGTGTVFGVTNSNGIVVGYLPAGNVVLSTVYNNAAVTHNFTVTEACSTIFRVQTSISEGDAQTGKPNVLDKTDTSGVKDNSSVTASGGTTIRWSLTQNGCLYIDGNGPMTDYEYSSETPWYPYKSQIKYIVIGNGVSSIDGYAFSRCSNLTNVTIPDSVTSIGSGAFSECTSLTNVTIPDSVISIGYGAFSECYSLTNINIPDGVTVIESSTFYDCKKLTSVTIPNSVTSIGVQAFARCTNLSSLTIPDSVTSIEWGAFGSCASLTRVTIGNGMSSIDGYAFADCDSLNGIFVGAGNSSFSSDAFGVLFDKGKNILIQAPGGMTGSYNIPNSVASIGEASFAYCRKLTTITISNSVISIGSSAFAFCDRLTTVTIPNSVTSIGSGAFSECTSLTNVTIPDSLKNIGSYAFEYCDRLKTIYFTGDAPSIHKKAFFDTTITAYYPANNSTWTDSVRQDYGGRIAWVAYTPGEVQTANMDDRAIFEEMFSDMEKSNAVFGGEYGTEVTDSYTLKTADFSDLVPGEEYVLLSLASVEVENPLAAENLLYIDQGVAGEDGTLSFQYVQRVDTAVSYVMACGASTKDLADATITFPEMRSNGETALVSPTVTYDGKTLTENVDYVIVGDADYTEPGQYTCHIRGIYNYTGLVTCTYTVGVKAPVLSLSYPSLSFEDEILYNVYYTLDDATNVEEMGLVTFNEKLTDGTVDNAVDVIPGYVNEGTTYMAQTKGIPAKNLGDALYFKVYAKLSDGSYVYTDIAGYHAVAYANTVLNNASSSAKAKALVVAMLNYGAAAQEYFNYKTTALMNAGLTTEQQALVKVYDETMVNDVVKADTSKAGMFVMNGGYSNIWPTVSFEGAFSINFYFTPNKTVDDGLTFYYWDAKTYNSVDVLTPENATGVLEMNQSGKNWGAAVEGIAAKAIDETVYVAGFYTCDGVEYPTSVVAYSLGNYCKTIAEKGNAFGAATAVYGFYANYFAS